MSHPTPAAVARASGRVDVVADLATQEEMAAVLREGARLLYTVAAGQFFELGDVNAWVERYNALVQRLGNDSDEALRLGDTFGAIGQRQSEVDPLIEQAKAALEDLAGRAVSARDDFTGAVIASQQSGGA